MCIQCKQYGNKFVITSPITPTEIEVWNTVMSKDYPAWLNRIGYKCFMWWHRYATWDYKKMA